MNASRRPAPPSTALVAVVLLAVAAYVVWSGRDVPVAGPAGAPVAESPAAPSLAPETRPSAASAPAEAAPAGAPSARPAAGRTAAAPVSSLVMRGQRIHDEQGRLVYEGDVDLAPVFARIDAGERDPHRNDGTTFANREGRLPRQPRGYYTEWVVRTEGLRGVGPQRLVTGRGGEAFYTPDHYETFVPVRRPS